MKAETCCALLAGVSLFCGAETSILWPSEGSKPECHSDTKMTVDKDSAVLLETGSTYTWPGVTIAFSGGKRDLSDYGMILATVSNTTDRTLNICISVKSGNGQRDGGRGFPPHTSGVIKASLHSSRYILDKPLELVGMRGFPQYDDEGSKFNIHKVSSVHVFIGKQEEKAGFVLLGMCAEKSPCKKLSTDSFFPFVDTFGQFKHDDWPGKIHSEEELQHARTQEDAWLDAHENDTPERDKWGGWAKGPQCKATGFFRTEKVNGKWWLVDPDGKLFYSHGVDCVGEGQQTGIQHRERYFSDLPPKNGIFACCYGKAYWAPHGFYTHHCPFEIFDFAKANRIRKYGTDWKNEFRVRAHRRIHGWGLNTIANWSDPDVYALARTPYTVTFSPKGIPIAGSNGYWGKFRDPYSKQFETSLKECMEAQRKAGSDKDPFCIGYFVDNEISWGYDNLDLARATLSSPADQPAKKAFLVWLQKKYAEIQLLNTAWGTAFTDWNAFLHSTTIPDEKRCGNDMKAFHLEIAEKYFRTIADAIHAVAPHRLYLGCRIANGASSVYRAAAKYCDVVSVNIYHHYPTKDLPKGSEDKPMIIGEFHFGALDRGLFHTGLVATQSQDERAQFYRDYHEACLKHPRYVGAHWFQWQDQALTGRGDGENYQIGFLTVTDQPYPELVRASRDIGAKMYTERYGKQR